MRILMKNFGLMALLFCGVLAVYAADADKPAKEKAVGDPDTATTCPVSGEVLGKKGDPIVLDYKGREVRLCCKGCVKAFEADPEKYINKIDKEIIKEQKDLYPLTTCVVSGEKLGEDGPAVDFVYNNRLFRLCCKGCVAKIKADPQKYFDKLDEAVIEKQKANYPLKTCVVSGEELGKMGKPYDIVIGNHLIRLCCKGCVAKVEKSPLTYLDKLAAAQKK